MNETHPSRHAGAETPPANHWQRWAAAPVAAAIAEATVPAAAVVADNLMALSVAPAQGDDTAVSPDAPLLPEPASGDAPYRILVVEDDRAQALFAQSVLHGAGMQAEVVGNTESVLSAIQSHAPDLILMDLHPPGLDGMHLTAMIRQRPGMQMLPILLLSSDPDPERRFEVLDSGADDYLNKPIRPRHLVAAVSNRIRRARAQAASLSDSHGGPLLNNPETGLPTRRHLQQQLVDALFRREHGGLYFIEIGNALGLRERYGHATFERLMVQAGQRLADAMQPFLLARLNDNSFLALARGSDEEQLGSTAQALREQLSARPFIIRDDESAHLRGIVGFAALSQGLGDAGSALEAIERTALQARLLPSGIAGFDPRLTPRNDERLALLDGQLELAYQPIVAVAAGDNAQYQVQLRLRRPDGRLLTAAQAIPVAESAGRIADLDQQVMEHALGLLDQRRHATPPLHLFVPQSLHTLAHDAFVDWLAASLQQRRLDGNALVIDVRLPDALLHTVTLQQFCARAATSGVRFCLSDFEPGPEANALLAQLPFAFVRMAARYSSRNATAQAHDALRGALEAARQAKVQIIGQPSEDTQATAPTWLDGVDFIQRNRVQSAGSNLDFDFPNAVP
ncbi:EAL domain-containing protein [Stenotrophomonas tumulicola]